MKCEWTVHLGTTRSFSHFPCDNGVLFVASDAKCPSRGSFLQCILSLITLYPLRLQDIMSSSPPHKPASPSGTAPPTKHGDDKDVPQRIVIELTNTQKRELREAFDLFDAQGTGRIPATDVKVALRALGFEVKKEELRQLLSEVGCNVHSTIDFNEFMSVLLLKAGERETKSEVLRAFRQLDVADKGFVAMEDIQQVAELLEQDLTEDELREMMDFAHPRSSTGVQQQSGGTKREAFGGKDAVHVTEEDFMRIMKRANVY